MARNLPTPCCGSYDIQISENEEQHFVCTCVQCGLQYGEPAVSRSETLYNGEEAIFRGWKKYPNGMRDWMRTKPQNPKELRQRLRIERDVKAAFEQETIIRRY